MMVILPYYLYQNHYGWCFLLHALLWYDYFKDNNEIINAEILGYIRYPTQKKMFTPENSISSNEWYYYDLEQIQTFLNVKINQKFFIKNMSNYAENFLLPSSQNHNFSNNHLQYAITWFLMSFSFLIIFIIYLFRKKKWKHI